MTLADAIDAVVGSTGHQRYRFLCSEANPNARQREAYRRHVLRLATGEEAARPAPRATRPAPARPEPGVDWSSRIRECPDFHPGCCSSPAPFCSRFNINPTRERCIECLKGGSL